MHNKKNIVIIYTDGACSGNPGIGGWGAVLEYNGHIKEIFGGEKDTTNNRMEIIAAIRALQTLKKPCKVELYTDSNYLKEGITKWIHQWKRHNWRSSSKKPIKNVDLWQELDLVASGHEISWRWVRGHAGNPGNEKADALAGMGIEQVMKTRNYEN